MNQHDTRAIREDALEKLRLLGAAHPDAALSRRCEAFLVAATSPAAVAPGYKHFPADATAVLAQARSEAGEGIDRLVLCGALLCAVARTAETEALAGLPRRVRSHQLRQLARIITVADADSPWMSLEDDRFHKEFGLASLRLLAAAAQVLDLRSGIPRSVVVRQVLKAGEWHLVPAFLRLKGFHPLIEIHTHQGYLDDFNEEGWNECYRCCSEVYEQHPRLLGMFGASWFYDPQLERISPRLGYLSTIPLGGGAFRFLMAERGEFAQDAIATSPTRRQLYESGQYRPRSFMLVWPRTQQSQWAAGGA